MLNVKVKTKPITRFLHFGRVPFFYVGGGSFRVTARIKNFDSTTFQGGMLKIVIQYAFTSFLETIEARIGAIEAHKEITVELGNKGVILGVLSQGHAIFWAEVVNNASNSVDLCDANGTSLGKQLHEITTFANGSFSKSAVYRSQVHSFHSLTAGELYTLIAIEVSTFVFLINVFLTIIVNYQKLSEAWMAFISYSIPVSLFGLVAFIFFCVVFAWLFFVHHVYDRYGLYRS
jgi:hypothetical protein